MKSALVISSFVVIERLIPGFDESLESWQSPARRLAKIVHGSLHVGDGLREGSLIGRLSCGRSSDESQQKK
jgi:hypothetical protein